MLSSRLYAFNRLVVHFYCIFFLVSVPHFLHLFLSGSAAFGRSLLLSLLAVSGLFCSFFAFDTLGDSHGWRAGLGAAAALLGASLSLMLGYCCCERHLDEAGRGEASLALSPRGCVGCCVGCCGSCARDVEGGRETEDIEEMRSTDLEMRNTVTRHGSMLSSTENPMAVQQQKL